MPFKVFFSSCRGNYEFAVALVALQSVCCGVLFCVVVKQNATGDLVTHNPP